jgi:hypothetical protein
MFCGEFELSLQKISTSVRGEGGRVISFVVDKYVGDKTLKINSQEGLFQELVINWRDDDIFSQKSIRVTIIESSESADKIVRDQLINLVTEEKVLTSVKEYDGIFKILFDSIYSAKPEIEILIYSTKQNIDSILSSINSGRSYRYSIWFNMGDLFASQCLKYGDDPDGRDCNWTIPTLKDEWGSKVIDNQPLYACRLFLTPKDEVLNFLNAAELNIAIEQLNAKNMSTLAGISSLINWVFNINVIIAFLLVILILVGIF